MRRTNSLMAAACLLLATTYVVHAQEPLPNKPIRILVGFTPGSGTDFLARTVGLKLAESWGQSVVVDNRPGAGGVIASDLLKRSTPDGHSLMVVANGHAVNAVLMSKLPYDTVRDFAGISVVHVPFKGAPEILGNVISADVQFAFSPISSAAPFVTASRLTGLALSSKDRSPVLPNVPTLAESGLPGFDFSGWYGMFAPAGTPKAVKEKLSREIARMLALPDVKERLLTQGATPKSSSPENLDAFVREEIARMARLVKVAGIKIE